MERRIVTRIVLTTVLAVTLVVGCNMALLDTVKKEVDAYNEARSGSPLMIVSKGVDVIEDGDEVGIGPEVSGQQKSVTFTIENQGSASLHLNGSPRISISTANPDEFGIISLPATVIGVGGKSDFVIQFSPLGSGGRTATITIPNDSVDGAVFSFDMAGTGVVGAGGEIQVSQGATVIDDNPGYETDYGLVSVGQTSSRTYTIENIGTSASLLHLFGSPKVNLTGGDASQFTVTTQPDKDYLQEGNPLFATTTFTIQYHPDAPGVHSVTVSISNDEVNADETPYEFEVTGEGFTIDVALIVDTSGTMSPILMMIKSMIPELISVFTDSDPGAQFGLAEFSDYPMSPFGVTGLDVSYLQLSDITSDTATLQAYVNALAIRYGADPWGSELDAFAGAANQMSWRPGSIRIAVMITNSPPHNWTYSDPSYPGITAGQALSDMQSANVAAAALVYNGYYVEQLVDLLDNYLCAQTGGAWTLDADLYNGAEQILESVMAQR